MQKIVIVGGGAGGLELAARLGNQLGRKNVAEVILIDQNRAHIWKPLLHEVATGSLDTSTDGVVYHAHAARHHYQFQLGTLCGVDHTAKTITLAELVDEAGERVLPQRTISFDTLVLAFGSVSNDFGTPGVKEHCYFLDSAKQAERFHHALLNNFMRIDLQNAEQKQHPQPLNIAIVGGGATGVELSAELYHVVALLKSYGMPNMTSQQLKITLIEAGERILPALPQRIADSARKELVKLGVDVCEQTMVKSASEAGFTTADGTVIEADMMIWAAGVKAPDVVSSFSGFELNRINQILVKPTLQSTLSDDIYVIGDCCGCQQQDGSWVPPRAQSAHQMASLVRQNIVNKRKGKALASYIYKDYGSLVSLSRFSTVGSLMGNLTSNSMFIEGRIARMVYISLYRMHQIAVHGWAKAIMVIAAEKISKVVKPKMKLH